MSGQLDAGRGERERVFLCHSSKDKAAVRSLYGRLRDDGLDPWLDTVDLLPGQDWALEIPRAVRRAAVVVVCLSPDAVTTSGYIHKEIKFALDEADKKPEGSIYIVPVRLRDCAVPDRLSQWQWVDLFAADGYERLVESLRQHGLREKPQGHDLGDKSQAARESVDAQLSDKQRSRLLSTLWRDPVWSKVISTGIVAVIAAIGALVWGSLRAAPERARASHFPEATVPGEGPRAAAIPAPLQPPAPTVPAPSIKKEPLR